MSGWALPGGGLAGAAREAEGWKQRKRKTRDGWSGSRKSVEGRQDEGWGQVKGQEAGIGEEEASEGPSFYQSQPLLQTSYQAALRSSLHWGQRKV